MMTCFPQRSWFLLQPPSDLHGLGHTARVMTWACVLARDSEWFEPVIWAAACHDLRRQDDGPDREHGFRAGAWVRGTLPGLLHEPPAYLEWIASACDWHVCPDREAQWDHPVLWLLKDADGLDRARLYDLDPSFLRQPQARRLVRDAHALYEVTADLDSPAEIWNFAAELDLPVTPLLDWAAQQENNLRNPLASSGIGF
jgi:hypothetical protein